MLRTIISDPAYPFVRTQYVVPPTPVPPVPPPPVPPIPYLISGTVYNERYGGTGFSAPLTLSGTGSVVSDASGSYGFLVMAASNVTVTPVYAGGTFSPDSRTYLNVSIDHLNQDYAFWDETPIHTFTGSVFYSVDGSPIASAVVEFNSGTIITDSSGSFGFSLYRGYSYDVIPHRANGSFDPASATGVADNNGTFNFAFTRFPAAISGEFRLDGAPVFGASIVYDADGQAVTDMSGSYSQTLYVGYTGTAHPNYFNEWPSPQYTVTPQVRVYTDLAGDVAGQDYDVTTNFFTISGTFGFGGTIGGVSDFFVSNGTNSWLADSVTGSYGFDVLSGWSGTVTSAQYITVPDSYVFTNVVANQPYQNFEMTQPFLMIADNYFDWSGWSYEVPDRWFIYARNPVDFTYSAYATNAGTVQNITIVDTGSYYHINGVNIDSSPATLATDDTYAAPPLPPVFLLSGSVFNGTDGSGLPANLYVDGVGTVATDGAGVWSQGVTSPYTGYVAVADVFNGDFAPAYYSYVAETLPQTNVDFVFTGSTVAISGALRVNGSLQANESISFAGLGGTTVYTNDNGTYMGIVPSGFTGITWVNNYGIPAFVFAPVVGTDPAYGTYAYNSVTTDLTGQDYELTSAQFLISGTVTDAAAGTGFAAPVVFTNGTGTVMSDAVSGSYGVLGHYGWVTTATPYFSGGTFDPASRNYNIIGGNQYPNQNYTFYADVPSPTDCQIPTSLQTIVDLPTPNDVSRSVNDPVNNLIWYIDDSYDYVYYVDAFGGTFAGSVTLTNSFGHTAIVYDPTNDKVVVMDFSGSIHVIDPAAKTSTRVPGISMVNPGYHMLAVNDVGTVYATDNRNTSFGSVWAVDVASASLIRSTKLTVYTDSICWASNINKLVINSGGPGSPAFYIFDPDTDTFSASTLLNPGVSFRYENYYIPQTGHMLESFSGGSPSAVIDISQGTAATQITTIAPTRVSNADIDTCTNHLFVTNGNYAMWEYTLDGSYTLLNVFDRNGAGISPNSCSHNRQSNLIYVADYSDGTIYSYMATRESGSIGGLVWTVDQGVSPDNSGGYMAIAAGDGWFSGSAVGEASTPFNQYNPDATAALSNIDAPYVGTLTTVYSGSLQDSGTIDFDSSLYVAQYISPVGWTSFSTTGTNGTFNGTLVSVGTISGYETFEVTATAQNGGNFTVSPCNTYAAISGSITFRPLTPP